MDSIEYHIADVIFAIQGWGMGTNGEHSCR